MLTFLLHWCYIAALAFICFRLTKGRDPFFQPKQLLRDYYIWWCYFTKWPSIILQSASKWFFSAYEPTIKNYESYDDKYFNTNTSCIEQKIILGDFEIY